MSSKLKRKPAAKPPNVKKNRCWIGARGKYLTVRELVHNVHLMHRNGIGITAIATIAGVNYRTVRRILLREPEEVFPEIITDSKLYAIVSERALPTNLKPEDYPFDPLEGPWLHGAKIEQSDLFSVIARVRAMGSDYGVIDVYKLERVDLRAIEDAVINNPDHINLNTGDA